LVRDRLLCEPLSGHLFLFRNAQRNRLKILCWAVVDFGSARRNYREVASVGRSPAMPKAKVVLSHEELSLLLGGIDLTKTKNKQWYRKVNAEGDAAA
jgi:transposase